jgi:O-antigen ligase
MGACASLSYMQLLLPYLLPLAPLIIAPRLFFYFDVIPRLAFVLILIAMMLLLRRELPVALAHFYKTQSGRWLCWIGALQCLSLIASTVLSSRPWLSCNGSTWRRYGLVTQLSLLVLTAILAVDFGANRRRLQTFLRTFTVSGLVAAIYGILQYFGVDPMLDPARYHVGEGIWTIVRPPSTLGHADYFGVYLLAVIFAAAALLTIEKNRYWRITAMAVIAVASFAVILSGTRAALVGLFIGGIFSLLFARPRLNRRHAVIALALAGGLAAFYVSPFGMLLRARTRWSLEDASGGARPLLWRDSLTMAAQRPVIGYGPEMFAVEFPTFQSIELARAYPDFYYESPHNMLLDGLVAQGLPGLAVLLGSIWLGVIAGFKARPADRTLSAALLGGFLALIVSQQFFSFTVSTALCFCFFLAALLALSNSDPTTQPKTLAHPMVWRLAAAACASIFVIYGLRLLIADHLLAEVRDNLATNNVSAATATYKKALYYLPPGPTADLYYSRSMVAAMARAQDPLSGVQAWQQGLQAGLRAVHSTDEPANAAYSLASLYARRNDATGTESSLRAAITMAPNWFKPHWMLARVLLVAGRLREAEMEATAAIDRSNKNSNKELLDTLQQIRQKLDLTQPSVQQKR